jgi:sugar lactone lactonase YvrE
MRDWPNKNMKERSVGDAKGLQVRRYVFRPALFSACLGLAACGGGGGTSTPAAPAPAPVPAPPSPPVVAAQPQAQSVGAGTAPVFSVTSGNATSYQWQRSTDGGITWADIAGASSASLTLPPAGLIDGGIQYRVTLTNGLGSTTSNSAALTVRPNLRLMAGVLGGQGYLDATGSSARFRGPRGTAVDAAGNVYVADSDSHVIRRITPAGLVSTIAGAAGMPGRVDGTALSARFDVPRTIAIDGAGTIWVVDQGTCYLRRIAGGQVSSFANLALGGCFLTDQNSKTAADPADIAVGPNGDIFVSDRAQHVILRVDKSGAVTGYAGSYQIAGTLDGPRLSAYFNNPRGLAFDQGGNLYVADSRNSTIRKIAVDGTVTTIAGNAGQVGVIDGTGAAARFASPRGLAMAGANRLLVTDSSADTVRQIDLATSSVTTLAGSPGVSGSADGTGANASFYVPMGIAGDSAGVAYVADSANHLIRRIDPSGTVTRLAGQPGTPGSADGTGSAARFSDARKIVADSAGNVYLADTWNHTIRKITPAGVVSTLAGAAGQGGSADGSGSAARFSAPMDIAIDGGGNLYVADFGNCMIRRVSPVGDVVTIAGQAGDCGHSDGPPSQSRLGYVTSLAVDASGNVAFWDPICMLRRLSNGVVTTDSGLSGPCALADGPAGVARVASPGALTFEPSGSIAFVDKNTMVRRLRTDGSIETIAGSMRGNADGTGSSAKFESITALSVDAAGRIYVVDSGNQAVRLIGTDRSVKTLIPYAVGPRVVLGDMPSLNYPVGLALLPGNAIAVTSEFAVLFD